MTSLAPPGLTWRYDRSEMIADGVVHAVGSVLGLAGAGALVYGAVTKPSSAAEAASVCIYAAGLLAMLGCSAAYNLWPVSNTKWLLRRADHAAIYLLIAGTYTPFIAQLERGSASILLFCGVWLTAAIGIGFKLLLPGRLDRVSIVLYLLLSWSGVAAYRPVVAAVPAYSLWLLLAGGIVYSAGVIFHLWHDLKFQNAIWHGFVLVGAGLHYFAVWGVLGPAGSA